MNKATKKGKRVVWVTKGVLMNVANSSLGPVVGISRVMRYKKKRKIGKRKGAKKRKEKDEKE